MPTNPFEPPKEVKLDEELARLEVPDAVLDLVPESVAREYGVLPVAHSDRVLYCFVAAEAFENGRPIAKVLSSCFDGQVCYATVPQRALEAVIERHYSRLDSVVFEISAPHIWVLADGSKRAR